MTDPYTTLNVPRDASADDIKAAYRKACAQNHPDRGGSTDAMAAINDAYAILGDQDRRKRFDETGAANEEATTDQRARSHIMQAFAHALENERILDPIVFVRDDLQNLIDQGARINLQATCLISRLNRQRGKLKSKSGNTMLHNIIDEKIRHSTEAIEHNKRGIEMAARALEMLDDFDFEVEPVMGGKLTQMPGDGLSIAESFGVRGGRSFFFPGT